MNHIIDRVQIVSAVLVVLIMGWTVIDVIAFDWPIWGILVAMRIVSALIFLALAWPWKVERTVKYAFIVLIIMLMGPPVFYVLTLPLMAGAQLSLFGEISAALYPLLPLVMIAGLSLFPLTVLELALLGLPAIAVVAYGESLGDNFEWVDYIKSIWLAVLIFGTSAFASITQLRYMISLINRASYDPLTGVFTRRSGSEIVDIQFRISSRQDTPFSIAFFDLDNFKSINDTYGHEEGDQILRQLIKFMQEAMRQSDTIIRWGGEEFVAMFPNTGEEGMMLVLKRIMDGWFGNRPDGKPLTASIGIAERKADNIEDWPELVELADQRMYMAKKEGRSRAVVVGNNVITADDVLKHEFSKSTQ